MTMKLIFFIKTFEVSRVISELALLKLLIQNISLIVIKLKLLYYIKKGQLKKLSFTTFYAIYNIPKTIVNITKAIDNIIVHLFCLPSFVLPLFFSQKLFVDEPVIVEDSPASSFDCIKVNIIIAKEIKKYITINIPFTIPIYLFLLTVFSLLLMYCIVTYIYIKCKYFLHIMFLF